MAAALSDARLQAHYGAQFATAAGISYLAARTDDSHTNLEWIPREGALASNVVPSRPAFRIGIRISDLSLVFMDAESAVRAALPLHGHTVAEATDWLRTQLTAAGADAAHYTLQRHYELPPHSVLNGAPFNAAQSATFAQLAGWFGNAAAVLGALVSATPGASEVRCWPHHFDIATLIDLGGGRTIGVGLEPGDHYYNEPYFYVNLRPVPPAGAALPALLGSGSWHTHEWIGAVLPGSRLVSDAGGQERQARAFLDSAVTACRTLLGARQ